MYVETLDNGFKVNFSNGSKGFFFDATITSPPTGSIGLQQIHSNIVHEVNSLASPPAGDALISSTPNINLFIRTADCIPLIATGTKVVGVCHAGWKGFAHNIFKPFLKTLAKYSTDIEFAIGPSICLNHFEVGNDVLAQVLKPFSKGAQQGVFTPSTNSGKSMLDLKTLLKNYLTKEKGYVNIVDIECCTFCDPRFASFRRNKTLQRNISTISL